MTDWASGDPMLVRSDTFYLPEPGHDLGVSILDEAGRDTDCGAPLVAPPPRPGARPREHFYGGRRAPCRGGVGTDCRGELCSIYGVAWDERPLHYNPNAGPDWAHLQPPRHPERAHCPFAPPVECCAPRRAWETFQGAPAPPAAPVAAPPAAPPAAGGWCPPVLLLVVLAALIAALLTQARLVRSLEKAVKRSVRALGSACYAGAPTSSG